MDQPYAATPDPAKHDAKNAWVTQIEPGPISQLKRRCNMKAKGAERATEPSTPCK